MMSPCERSVYLRTVATSARRGDSSTVLFYPSTIKYSISLEITQVLLRQTAKPYYCFYS